MQQLVFDPLLQLAFAPLFCLLVSTLSAAPSVASSPSSSIRARQSLRTLSCTSEELAERNWERSPSASF